MLLYEFIKPLRMSQTAFALRMGVSYPRLNEIIHAKRSVTVDTALRIAHLTGMRADIWMGLQLDWDLWHLHHSPEGREIAKLKRIPRPKQRD
jgi:addiction module HigA family antidote